MNKAISILFILVYTALSGLTVGFQNQKGQEILKKTKRNNMEYYSLSEIQKVFKTSRIQEDLSEAKLSFSLYNESMIILMNSSYLSFHGNLYNFYHPVFYDNYNWYIPKSFLTELLPRLYPEKIRYNAGNDQISASFSTDSRIKTIVIDPGHGGKDPGATGKNSSEKDITLDVAFQLKKAIETRMEGVNVLLTRSRDEFVSLQSRTQFANKKQAQLFVSIHCNAAMARSSQGIETFFLSTARTTDARAVEALENSVVLNYEGGQDAVKNYDDLQFILADLQQSEQLEESSNLALRIQSSLIDATSASDRGVKQAGFYVLKGAFMPSVLVEIGFISNEEEEKRLLDTNHQSKIVDALFKGIHSFKQKYDYLQ